jgi:hypothetical protein
MSEGERVYFQPGVNPPFPGYEAWLEEVKRAPFWQAKAPRPYVPDMRDGLGKELFPPPPPRSNLEPRSSVYYDRNAIIAAMESIWKERPDLVWEMLWWKQFLIDDPDEGERIAAERRHDMMFRWAIRYELAKKFPAWGNGGELDALTELQSQLGDVLTSLPLSVRRSPWSY